MRIQVELVPTLKGLIRKARAANAKRVLLTSYGSVEPAQDGEHWVLAGMTTVAATALDPKSRKIYRWQERGRSKGPVTIRAGARNGPVAEGEPMARLRDDVYQVLRDEGFEVDDGEWTPESAERSLRVRKKLIG